jgi:hypothetical protein
MRHALQLGSISGSYWWKGDPFTPATSETVNGGALNSSQQWLVPQLPVDPLPIGKVSRWLTVIVVSLTPTCENLIGGTPSTSKSDWTSLGPSQNLIGGTSSTSKSDWMSPRPSQNLIGGTTSTSKSDWTSPRPSQNLIGGTPSWKESDRICGALVSYELLFWPLTLFPTMFFWPLTLFPMMFFWPATNKQTNKQTHLIFFVW